jgi:hypothetical protein
VYAFFRSRTLGYDVYPEDYFIPNFPWQQYGGLWICDEARFARSQAMSALVAQALRRITGEGASPGPSSSTSPTSSFTSNSFHHQPAESAVHAQLQSFVPPFDGSTSVYKTTIPQNGSSPVLNMRGSHPVQTQPQPHLSCLTDVGRRYPGFPTPLSPTSHAKDLFPSPISAIGSGPSTPRPLSPSAASAP